VDQGQVEPTVGWRVILTAALSNLVTKAIVAGFLGRGRLFGWVAGLFGVAFAGGIALLCLWPG
ncbi:MAG: MgtC/SapB family protein, partial [Planctomycetia bacterium]|nr:MgtC/SapB family protein [Planctomycetia bacterium]